MKSYLLSIVIAAQESRRSLQYLFRWNVIQVNPCSGFQEVEYHAEARYQLTQYSLKNEQRSHTRTIIAQRKESSPVATMKLSMSAVICRLPWRALVRSRVGQSRRHDLMCRGGRQNTERESTVIRQGKLWSSKINSKVFPCVSQLPWLAARGGDILANAKLITRSRLNQQFLFSPLFFPYNAMQSIHAADA